MILDYSYNKSKREFSISYITPSGGRSLLKYNVQRFKSFTKAINGPYKNWDGSNCIERWTDRPSNMDFFNFIHELPQADLAKLLGKYNPRLYTWDIETKFDPTEFPDPFESKFPVTVISVANDCLDVVELGTMPLSDADRLWVQEQILAYLNQSEFYRSLKLREPKFTYIQFNTEEEMLEYFLKNIAAKTPVLAGWNSDGFDNLYIQTRIKNNFPNLSMNMSSPTWTCSSRNYQNKKGDKYRLFKPNHVVMIDLMDVTENFDMTLSQKESMSLDVIAKQCTGLGKIEYDGDLEHLRQTNYPKYVFYSCIDSILVQLIDKKLRTMNNIYAQALYCKTKVSDAFSKIAISEAVTFDYFFSKGIKICPDDRKDRTRPPLTGAYVRQPTPGKYNWVCCNDFSSLYPSCIATCNLSFENYLGSLRDGTFTEEQIELYKTDPKYFVSVNGSVYQNDKSYAFKEIQLKLKEERNYSKYLAKQLYADVAADLYHIIDGKKPKNQQYNANEVAKLKELGYDIKCTNDLYAIEDKHYFDLLLTSEITYLTSFEQACKLVMNSMYGGSSHVAFFWFNIDIANDITGEGRNLIHMMEDHIPKWIDENWDSLTEVHKQLGIEVIPGVKNLIQLVAGDTDSLYSCYENWVKSIKGHENMSIEQIRDIIVKFNTGFFDRHNKEFMDEYYKTRFAESIHNFELETVAYSDVRLKVKKRYAQLLCWKDGYCPDVDNLPLKSKGLELIKASYPALARNGLKKIVRALLETDKKGLPLQRYLSEILKEERVKWMERPVEELCENKGVNNYTKYILSDDDQFGVQVAPKCPYHVRALANRNWTIKTKGFRGELLYGGKMKVYPVKKTDKRAIDNSFAFMASDYPEWAEKYWPCDRVACFQKFYVDPFNRILDSVGERLLNQSGDISISLFDEF